MFAMMIGFSFYCLVPLIIWILWKLYVRSVDRKLININDGSTMPGPQPSFLGLSELWVFIHGAIPGLIVKYRHYGPVIRVFVGPFPWVILTDYESYSIFFTNVKSFRRGKFADALENVCPGTLFVLDGYEWRQHRLAMNPFLSEEVLEKMLEEFLEITKLEYDEIETDKPFLLTTLTNSITARLLMKGLFKVGVNKKK
jgi:hypothetical protein